ncbi:MAG: hypothetical protein AB2707_20280, partial [Candidatus Thiodiazotropha sp.]
TTNEYYARQDDRDFTRGPVASMLSEHTPPSKSSRKSNLPSLSRLSLFRLPPFRADYFFLTVGCYVKSNINAKNTL